MTAITLVTSRAPATPTDPIVTIAPAPGDTTGTGATATITDPAGSQRARSLQTMEAFQDTPVVNGTAYPYMDVQPQAYRFRILNAADDRIVEPAAVHGQHASSTSITVTNGGSGYTSRPLVTITPAPGDTTGMGATADGRSSIR